MTLTDHPSTAGIHPSDTPTPEEPPAIVVRPWHDSTLVRDGHTPRSEYVERFWLGVIGPSACEVSLDVSVKTSPMSAGRFTAGSQHFPECQRSPRP